jgi:hypothetical protein
MFHIRVQAGSLHKAIHTFYLTEFEIVHNLYKKLIQKIKIMVKPEAVLPGQVVPMLPSILSLPGNGPTQKDF